MGDAAEALPRDPVLDWRIFRSDPGGFSVLLPGEPEHLSRETSTIVGGVRENKYLVPVGNGFFSVGLHELPRLSNFFAPARVILSQTKNQILKGTKSEELSFDEFDDPRFPARVLRYRNGVEGFTIEEVRMILVGRRLYLLTAGYDESDADRTLMDRFFDSFVLESKE